MKRCQPTTGPWRSGSKSGALAPREHARHGARSLRPIVEERRRPAEPAHAPAKHPRRAAGENPERRRIGRVRRERPDGGSFVDAAERRTQHLIPGTTVGLVIHEGMNYADDREARPGGGVRNRGPATIAVPAQNLVGEAQTPHGVRAGGELHAPGRHLEDVRSAGRVEHVGPLEETRERLAVLAVADDAEAGGRGDVTRDAAHAAAPAPKREVDDIAA